MRTQKFSAAFRLKEAFSKKAYLSKESLNPET